MKKIVMEAWVRVHIDVVVSGKRKNCDADSRQLLYNRCSAEFGRSPCVKIKCTTIEEHVFEQTPSSAISPRWRCDTEARSSTHVFDT